MKILNILFENVNNPTGGLGVHVKSIMSEVAILGHEVAILGYDNINFKFSCTYDNGCKIINCKNTNTHLDPKNAYYLLAINDMLTENLLYHLKHEQFDIIALHDSLLWPIAKYAAILFNAPIVTFCHLSHALVHADMPFTEQHKYEVTQEWHCYTQSHQVITCSRAYAKRVKEYFYLDRNFKVIHNGVDYKRLNQYSSENAVTEIPVVGFVGRVVPSKGMGLLIEAVKQCPDKHFIVIASVSPTIEDCIPLVTELRQLAKDYTNFTWYTDLHFDSDKKWQIMAACDVAIVPSLHEPFGIVALEWAALDVPRIISAVDGLAEFNGNDNAIIIQPTAESLIAAINTFSLLHSMQSMIDNADCLARGMTWKKAALKLIEAYEEVV